MKLRHTFEQASRNKPVGSVFYVVDEDEKVLLRERSITKVGRWLAERGIPAIKKLPNLSNQWTIDLGQAID